MLHTIRRAFFRLIRPAWRIALRRMVVVDPWERIEMSPALRLYGTGARQDFEWYLRGESRVTTTTVDDVCDWLVGCEYASDQELFGKRDHWQHPTTFEFRRRGDCEDHALWAWSQLLGMGIRAELVSGMWRQNADDAWGGHVWVLFERDGQSVLFETIAKGRDRMMRPLSEAEHNYHPEVGVGPDGKRFAFAGALEAMRHRELNAPVRIWSRGTA